MRINQAMVDEMELLAKFPRASHMQGIKVHSDADDAMREAAMRLFEKGITDSPDGGYLTDLRSRPRYPSRYTAFSTSITLSRGQFLLIASINFLQRLALELTPRFMLYEIHIFL